MSSRKEADDDVVTVYFTPFNYGAGGYYSLQPIHLIRGRLIRGRFPSPAFGHPFRILCTYNSKSCWPSSRGVPADLGVGTFRSLHKGFEWLQDEET